MPTDSRKIWASLFSLALILLAGCGSQPLKEEATVRTAEPIPATDEIINPQRSRRGNPPVYEVMGQRYYVMNSSVGYRESGTASWYGPDFHGRPTSSGEIYDMHAMTAAHKTLPIPTWVEVTNQRNGRSVIVKVNDRGPFVDGRIIDMSFAAAEALDMVRAGTTPVFVRALGEPVAAPTIISARAVSSPEPKPSRFSIISEAAAATPGIDDAPMQNIYAQVGAFSQHENAMKVMGTLRAGGLNAAFVLSNTGGPSGSLHRVRIGPLASIAAYDELLEKLASLGLTDSRLVFEP